MWQWKTRFSDVLPDQIVSLGEGMTPLVRSRRLGPRLGFSNLFFKVESGNPSGSYKDRFASAAVSGMIALGKTRCIATSSGNTGAALAAYCAAAGIECRIAVVEGAPAGKLRQMQAYGAKIARIRRFGTDAQETSRVIGLLEEVGSDPDSMLQISAFVHSPAGMAGVQSISYELSQALPAGIDHVFCPAGGGGLCVAVARGFQQMKSLNQIPDVPTVECVQPAGNATIAGPLRNGDPTACPVTCTTQVSGLQVASVIDGHLAVTECRATGGTGHLVLDEHVWELQSQLATDEGIFAEPAGAVALAGAVTALREGHVRSDAVIVCLVTGVGFKDETALDRMAGFGSCPVIDSADLHRWCREARASKGSA